MKRNFGKIISLLLSTCLLLAPLPATAATYSLDVSQWNIIIEDSTTTGNIKLIMRYGATELVDDNLDANTTFLLCGTTYETTVTVKANVPGGVNILLDNANIDLSGTYHTCAFKITPEAGAVNLTLADGSNNVLKSGQYCAGLQKENNTSALMGDEFGDDVRLTISGQSLGTGILNASTALGAGIGGGYNNGASHIAITGGTVNAAGGDYSAGIGGSGSGSGSYITISGGTVDADSGNDAAGIGGGNLGGSGSHITISGGSVTARCNEAYGAGTGAGIGGGRDGNAGDIIITGGTVNAIGSYYGAGIGGGKAGNAERITITGGTVTAACGKWGNGIGGGDNGNAGDITITGGNIKVVKGSSGGVDFGAVPKNNSGDAVYKAVFTVPGAADGMEVSGLDISGYNTSGIKTLDTDKVYFYLPEGPAIVNYDGLSYGAEVTPDGNAEFKRREVSITGTPRYGETLTAAVTGGSSLGTLSYQWKRGGTDGTNIGENSNTYRLTADDVGNTIACLVTNSMELGSASGVTEVSVDKMILTPSALSVTGREYDGTASAEGAIHLQGAAEGDFPTATGTFVWTDKDAGTSTVNISGIMLDEDWGRGYVLSTTAINGVTAPNNAKINAKALTISAPAPFTYGNTDTFTVSGYATGVGGETVTLTYTSSSKNAGTYSHGSSDTTNQFSLSLSDTNYSVGTAGGLTVLPRTVTVTAEDKSMTRGKALPTFTVTYSGFIGDDSESNTIETPPVAATAADGKTAGTFDITFSQQAMLNSGAGANYELTHETGALTVRAPASSGGYIAPPAASASGNVAKQTVLILIPSQKDSVIYYTSDGTAPTKNSTKYEYPLIMTKDTTIKFIEIGSRTSAVVTKDIKVKTNIVAFIDKADEARYIKPASDTLFAPDSEITRYDVLASLNNLLKFGSATLDTELTDVKEDMRQVVAYFQSADIIDGFEDGTFKGEQGLTRAEFVKVMSVILKLDIKDNASAFTDTKGHWADSYIAEFSKSRYLKGYEDGSFKPDQKVTRAEFVTIVNRIIQKNGVSVPPVFSDLPAGYWAYNDIMAAYLK